MTDLDKKAIGFLEKMDALYHADIISPIDSGLGTAVLADDHGVVARLGGTWYVEADSREKTLELAEWVIARWNPQMDGLCVHNDYATEEISRMSERDRVIPCRVCVHRSMEPFAIESELEFRQLDHTFDGFVFRTYRMIKDDPDGLEEAKEAIDRGMYGAFLDGKCVGFIGTHSEFSMGMLEILPEFRRRGYGEALEKHIANRLMEKGIRPFCHVIQDNVASLRLQADMGLWISSEEQLVYWFC